MGVQEAVKRRVHQVGGLHLENTHGEKLGSGWNRGKEGERKPGR